MSGAAHSPAAGPLATLLAWGRLARLSLAPTAAADVLAGLVLAGSGRLPGGATTGLLVAASLCVYHANLILNDWRDRDDDRRLRPARPLPAGAVAPRPALGVALALCVAGPAVAAIVGPRAAAWLGLVCALALLYNLRERGPWSGPVLLAACRATNLATGLVVGGLPLGRVWLAPVVYAAYVCCVARLGRLEDGADEGLSSQRPRHLLTGAAVLLAVCALPFLSLPLRPAQVGALALAVVAAAGLVARAHAVATWTPAAVEAAMGLALRRLLALTAAFALAAGGPHGPAVAAAILAGYPLSWGLRGVFPPS
ncbi:MAG: UbiA family prenyltransferase [Planctomycetota bacterium]|jgi:4-hydroxybenzoate polyprenyltransferase|nr:UbiA family prenyltransferase [Planctomycetota bacterium]MDP6764047.1 UbiA family prenyltransferase [Planctomycetota bacterium]MDP6989948.1 UbiA family prenyltransferase [Planctomycetota bacterium]